MEDHRTNFIQRMLEVQIEALEDPYTQSGLGERESSQQIFPTLEVQCHEIQEQTVVITRKRIDVGDEADPCQVTSHYETFWHKKSYGDMLPPFTSTQVPLSQTSRHSFSSSYLSSMSCSPKELEHENLERESSLQGARTSMKPSITSQYLPVESMRSSILSQRIDALRAALADENVSSTPAERSRQWASLSRMEAVQARREQVLSKRFSAVNSGAISPV